MPPKPPEPVAIIGMGCRFPSGADSPQKLGEILCQEKISVKQGGGKLMRALVSVFFIIAYLSVCHAQISPSDSSVIQKILDDNGVDSVSVSDIVRTDSSGILVSLYLSDLGLKTLPDEIGQLTTLTYLEVDNNDLITLPAEIDLLSSLEDLLLRGTVFPICP